MKYYWYGDSFAAVTPSDGKEIRLKQPNKLSYLEHLATPLRRILTLMSLTFSMILKFPNKISSTVIELFKITTLFGYSNRSDIYLLLRTPFFFIKALQ